MKIEAMRIVCGVYFLFRKGQLRYVGQSVNVAARVGDHMRNNPNLRDCDEVRVYECPAEDLSEWEGMFIRLLDPPANGRDGTGPHAPKSHMAATRVSSIDVPRTSREPDASARDAGNQNALLSRDQVAGRYGISRRWLELAAHKGEGPPMVKLSRCMVRYRPQDIEEWLRRKEVATA